MKQRILLSVVLVAALFTACIKSSFEDRAKKRLPDALEQILKKPYAELLGIDNQSVVFSGDSACIIHFDANIRGAYGEHISYPMEYILVWSSSRAGEPDLYEAVYPIGRVENAAKPLLISIKELRHDKTVDEETIRVHGALYCVFRGHTLEKHSKQGKGKPFKPID